MIAYRHTDPRRPFLWAGAGQPAGRWVDADGGPVHYLADTPDGAWAEFLRHEAITETADLSGIERGLWAVEIGDLPGAEPELDHATCIGGLSSYPACRAEAARLRAQGERGLVAPSAALAAGGAHGWRVTTWGQEAPGPSRDGRVVVLFGARPDLTGWAAADVGRPDPRLVGRVRPLTD